MSSAAERQAPEFLTPTGGGTGDPSKDRRAPTKTSFTGTSSGLIATNVSVTGQYMTFYATSACHIRFGDATLGAAVATDMFFPAGQLVSWFVTDINYRVIQDAAAGDLYAYVSSP